MYSESQASKSNRGRLKNGNPAGDYMKAPRERAQSPAVEVISIAGAGPSRESRSL